MYFILLLLIGMTLQSAKVCETDHGIVFMHSPSLVLVINDFREKTNFLNTSIRRRIFLSYMIQKR